MPAKNLMAKRRRRKKLNDRLYMLRASILGDAIEYLKELLQRINNELETSPADSPITFTPVSSFHPSSVASSIKEELCPTTTLPCQALQGPGLRFLTAMKTLDNLGLDIQQADISCLNGFAMDIFRAEQCMEGQDVHPEQIKALLLDSVGFHSNSMI
ncbi:hypothetical protein L6164_010890 [Bauhinia variegata]|uniref:Uncharacterized protein n=1 Tax=Bauhinia variegata TaxID=167791 RepID=A0ACB9P6S4_BAUVA|nr:hypothetical protein L6164_010890 [Bauhinia variegata]